MRISKARLKQIINEEVQNYKRQQGKISESINEVGVGDDLAAVENAIATLDQLRKNIDKGFANTVMGAMLELNKIQDYLKKEQGGQLEEGQPVMYPEEVQTVAQVVEPVAKGGGDLTAIGDALEQAGLKIQRGYRYIMVFVKYAKIMIAPTSAVELEGNETVIGKFAVGEMQE